MEILFTALFATSIGLAAPAVPSPLCQITGVVVSKDIRLQKYEPEQWRKTWKLPEHKEYVDVKLKLRDSNAVGVVPAPGCGLKVFEGKTFQLRDNKDAEKIKKGACIKAITQYSGDEFAIGQWLWDIGPC